MTTQRTLFRTTSHTASLLHEALARSHQRRCWPGGADRADWYWSARRRGEPPSGRGRPEG